MVTVYNGYDESAQSVDFDFSSTDPVVFRIAVHQDEWHTGWFADATFRGGHVAQKPYALTAYGETEHDALAAVLDMLKRWGKADGH